MRQSVLRVKGPWSVKSRGPPDVLCTTRDPDLCRHIPAGKAAGTSAAGARNNPPSGVCGRGSSTARAVSNKNDLQKRGRPSARPFACVSPLLAASREARATSSARARRRMPRPASRAIDGASTSPPAARQSCPYVRPAADLFPSGSWIGRLRPAVDSRRLSARQPTMRR